MSTPTTYNDGAAHTLTTAGTWFVVTAAGTTLDVQAGGSATGDASTDYSVSFDDAGPGVLVTAGAGLTVSGGTATGGVDAYGSGARPGVELNGADFQVTSGTVTGGAGLLWGAPGALVITPASLNLLGGAFVGGDGMDLTDGRGGTALVLVLAAGDAETLHDGTFTGGTGAAGNGYSLGFSGGGTLSVQNGHFGGDVGLDLTGAGGVTFYGTLTYNSGTGVLSGTLFGGDSITVTVVDLGSAPLVATNVGPGTAWAFTV